MRGQVEDFEQQEQRQKCKRRNGNEDEMNQESMSQKCSQKAPLLYRNAGSGRLMAMFIPTRTPIASALASVVALNP